MLFASVPREMPGPFHRGGNLEASFISVQIWQRFADIMIFHFIRCITDIPDIAFHHSYGGFQVLIRRKTIGTDVPNMHPFVAARNLTPQLILAQTGYYCKFNIEAQWCFCIWPKIQDTGYAGGC